MKKHTFLGVLAVIVAVLMPACSGENHFEGSENLKEASLSWIPFEGGETAVFTNASGDSIVFTANPKNQKYNRTTTSCDNGTWNTGGCIEKDLQHQGLTFQGRYHSLLLSYALDVKMTGNTRWDILRIGVSENSQTKAFFAFDVTQNGVPNTYESFFYADSVTLNRKKFGEVFRNKTEGSYNIYYNKTKGVVGFELGDGSVWALK